MVTHDQREAMTMSDLVVVMRDGLVEQVGEALDVYRRPATAFVARFVGSSNLLRGRAIASDRMRLGDHDVRVAGTALTAGADVTVSLRPEEAHLTLDERATVGGNVLTGTVVFMRDLGELFECYVDVGLDDPLIVAGSPKERIDVRPGDRTSVVFAPEACVVVAAEAP
jgi:putative spermidine/putrescine transport system ATP-binding protein